MLMPNPTTDDSGDETMTTIEKIEKGYWKMDEFTESQRQYILGLVKMSYSDGHRDGKNETEGKVMKALQGDY